MDVQKLDTPLGGVCGVGEGSGGDMGLTSVYVVQSEVLEELRALTR